MKFEKKNKMIIVISGLAGRGKNTVANIIKNELKAVINLAYADYLKEYAMKVSAWDGSEESKPRELLQNLGVELIKTNIDKNMLVRRMIEDIKVYSYYFPYITISDARFPNEIEQIKENFDNVITIRIN